MDIYLPLPSLHIRLLHIEPNTGPQIRCKLSTVPLTSCPQYEALSYTWGISLPNVSITISGQPFLITTNLYQALKNLRHDESNIERIVWVDAICINQRNDSERNAQVKLMQIIFGRASNVLIWLGEPTEHDHLAFSLLSQFHGVFEKHPDYILDFSHAEEAKAESNLGAPFGPLHGLPGVKSEKWVALIRMFQREWFERIWVVQEAVMAKEAKVVCGGLVVEWDLMMKFAACARVNGIVGSLDIVEDIPGCVSVNTMADLKDLSRRGSKPDLIDLLILTRSYKATESVDKVFALLGLLNNPGIDHPSAAIVDYKLNAHQVFEKVAIESLTCSKDLLCLSSAGSVQSSTSKQSWVPDWSHMNDYRGSLAATGRNVYQASGDTVATPVVSSDGKILHLIGYIVDSISTIANPILKYTPLPKGSGPLKDISEGDIMTIKTHVRTRISMERKEMANCESIAPLATLYPDFTTPLALTLCCDMLTSGQKVIPEHATKMYRYMSIIMRDEEEEGNWDQRGTEDITGGDIQGLMEIGMPLVHSHSYFGIGRSLCVTRRGDLGKVPFGTEEGDLVVVFKGGKVPFVVRGNGEGYYKLVGECYVHGIMYGQALQRDGLLKQEFKLQ